MWVFEVALTIDSRGENPLRRNLQGFVEQIVMAGDDVDKVADTARCVIRAVQMDMDAAGVIGETACPA